MKKPLLTTAIIAALCILTACDDAPKNDAEQKGAESTPVTPADQVQPQEDSSVSEELKPAIPESFAEVRRQKDDKTGSYVIEYLPSDQTLENWSEIITVIFYPMPDRNPEEFYNTMGMAMSEVCEGFSMEQPSTRDSEPYTMTIGGTYCGKNPESEKGEVSGYVIASGVKGLHILQRTIKTDPFEKGAQPLEKEFFDGWWKDFASASQLCTYYEDKDDICTQL